MHNFVVEFDEEKKYFEQFKIAKKKHNRLTVLDLDSENESYLIMV